MILPERSISFCVSCATKAGLLRVWVEDDTKGAFNCRGICTKCGFISATVTLAVFNLNVR